MVLPACPCLGSEGVLWISTMKNDWSLHGARLRSEKPKWLRELVWDPLVGPPRDEQRGGPGGAARAPKKVPDRKQYLGKQLLNPRSLRNRRNQHNKPSAWANAPGRDDIGQKKAGQDGPTGQYNVHYECVQSRAPSCLIMAPTHRARTRAGSGSRSPSLGEEGRSPSPGTSPRGAKGGGSPGSRRKGRGAGRPATSCGVPEEDGTPAIVEDEEEVGTLEVGSSPRSPRSRRRRGRKKAAAQLADDGVESITPRAKSSTPGPGGATGDGQALALPLSRGLVGQEAVFGHSPAAVFHSLSARRQAARESPWEPGDIPELRALSTTPRAPAFRIPTNESKKNTTRAALAEGGGGEGAKTPGAHYHVEYNRLSSERRVTSGVNFGGQTGRDQAVSHKTGASVASVGYWDRVNAGMTNERMRVHDDDGVIRKRQDGASFGQSTGREVLNSFNIERSGVRDLSDAPDSGPLTTTQPRGSGGRFNTKPDTWYAWRNETPQPTGAAKNLAVDMEMSMRDLRGRVKKPGAIAAIQALQECARVTEWFEFRVNDGDGVRRKKDAEGGL